MHPITFLPLNLRGGHSRKPPKSGHPAKQTQAKRMVRAMEASDTGLPHYCHERRRTDNRTAKNPATSREGCAQLGA
jgi:hypothetical protein